MNLDLFKEIFFSIINQFNSEILEKPNQHPIHTLTQMSETSDMSIQLGGDITFSKVSEEVEQKIKNKQLSGMELSDLEFDFNEYTPFNDNKYNILVLGSGPIGLYISILFKTIFPDLEITIFEKRDTNKKRKFDRAQIIKPNLQYRCTNESLQKLSTFVNYPISDTFKFEEPVLNLLPSAIYTNISKSLSFFSLENRSINLIEYFLSIEAQKLGINIVNIDIRSEDILKTHTTPNTLSIFNATGGRLPFFIPQWTIENPITRNCNYIISKRDSLIPEKNTSKINNTKTTDTYTLLSDTEFYHVECDKEQLIDKNQWIKESDNPKTGKFEFSVKGYNKHNIKKIDNIPLISIGDSFTSTDFTTGSGLQIGCGHSLGCVLLFNKIMKRLGISFTETTPINISKESKKMKTRRKKQRKSLTKKSPRKIKSPRV
uniref:Uncharacterized protein n=1 Tax=viral metagenome TaxID=1070528 RepID=A0A6C0KJ55_9ZZZZ